MTTPPYPGGDGFSVPGATPPVSSPQPIDYPGSYSGGYAAPAPYPAPSYPPPSYPAPSYPAPSYGGYGAPAPYVDPYNPYGAPPSRGTNGMALVLTQNGDFRFANSLPNGTTYNVVVAQQPLVGTCQVTNPTGITATNKLSLVSVSCQ